MFVNGRVEIGAWMRVECPCPLVHNDIVTPHRLFVELKRRQIKYFDWICTEVRMLAQFALKIRPLRIKKIS